MKYADGQLEFAVDLHVTAHGGSPVWLTEVELAYRIDVDTYSGDWDWMAHELSIFDHDAKSYRPVAKTHDGINGAILRAANDVLVKCHREIEELILEAEPEIRKMEAANNPARLSRKELV